MPARAFLIKTPIADPKAATFARGVATSVQPESGNPR